MKKLGITILILCALGCCVGGGYYITTQKKKLTTKLSRKINI